MPRRNGPNTRGADLAQRLQAGLHLARTAPHANARDLPALQGVTPRCEFVSPQDSVLSEFGEILIESGRIYKYGNNVVMETRDGDRRGLATLVTDGHIERTAAARLSNLVVCEQQSHDSDLIQFPPPQRLVDMILHHEPTLGRIPMIQMYATRPLFDDDFRLLGPGWHMRVGYLIHGTDIEPILPNNQTSSGEVGSQLPRRLRELLAGFCFRSIADLINTIALMLTGLLVTRFVVHGKPIFAIDGNQPSLVKTFLARILGVLFDAFEPTPIKYTSVDDEFEKKLCATLRGRRPQILLVDNAKVRGGVIESAVLEANSTAPHISLRILGTSTNHEQPNDVLWLVTMNSTRLGPDLTERSCPIRLHFDGDPTTRRQMRPDLIDFVRKNRLEILGELAGMVIHWSQRGRPNGTQTHRLSEWARIIGGILDANNLAGFLANLDEARTDFSSALDQLSALAEAAINRGVMVHIVDCVSPECTAPDVHTGLLARELEPLFQRANLLIEKLAENKSQTAKSNAIAAFLSPYINRTVPIETAPRRGQATLRRVEGRERRTRYHFDVLWTESNGDPAAVPQPADPGPLGELPLLASVFSGDRAGEAALAPPETGGGNDIRW